MAKPDDDDRTTSVGLYHFAESYRDCGEALAARRPDKLMFDAPIEFLFWHAIELYFKAYLRAQGATAAELRTKFGHNLSRLHAACVDQGLSLSRYPEAFFDFMDPDEAIEARYIRIGAKMAKPTVISLQGVTAEIRDAVAQALKARGQPVRWWNPSDH